MISPIRSAPEGVPDLGEGRVDREGQRGGEGVRPEPGSAEVLDRPARGLVLRAARELAVGRVHAALEGLRGGHGLEARAGRVEALDRAVEERPALPRDGREVVDRELEVEGRRRGHRDHLAGARLQRDHRARTARELLLRDGLHAGVEADVDVGPLLLAQVEALQERLGAEAAREVAVVGALEAGRRRLGRVADRLGGEVALGVEALEHLLPLHAHGAARGHDLAVGRDDPAPVDQALGLGRLLVARAVLEPVGGDHLPVPEHQHEQAEAGGERQVEAADRPVHATTSRSRSRAASWAARSRRLGRAAPERERWLMISSRATRAKFVTTLDPP